MPRFYPGTNVNAALNYEYSPFYRRNAGWWGPAGTIHGGIDMQYVGRPEYDVWSNDPVNANHPSVFSPVTGEVVAIERSWGGIVVKNLVDGTYHRIGHLYDYAINPLTGAQFEIGDDITQGQLVGYAGATGERRADGTIVNLREDGGPVHVHYDIVLEGGASGYQGVGTDNLIDPFVYWTTGLNPYTGLNSLSEQQRSTGLLVSSIALKDYNGDGTPETGGFLMEGELTYLNLEINTPHTRELVLRVTFSGARSDTLLFESHGVSADPVQANVAYVTVPATIHQACANCALHVERLATHGGASAARGVARQVAGADVKGAFVFQ